MGRGDGTRGDAGLLHSGGVIQGIGQWEVELGRGEGWGRYPVESVEGGGVMEGKLAGPALHETQLMQVEVDYSSSGVITGAALKGKFRKKGKGRKPLRQISENRVPLIREPKRKFQLLDEEMVEGENVEPKEEVCKRIKVIRDIEMMQVGGTNLD